MIYKNKNIPDNYNKIAEISDNYIVWVKESNLSNKNTYDAYIQYIKPNFYYIHDKNYHIKNGTNYVLNANYINNGVYSYIDNYDLEFTIKTTELTSGEDYSTNIEYIADYNEVNLSIFIVIICILFVFNHISKLWSKGGCFF